MSIRGTNVYIFMNMTQIMLLKFKLRFHPRHDCSLLATSRIIFPLWCTHILLLTFLGDTDEGQTKRKQMRKKQANNMQKKYAPTGRKWVFISVRAFTLQAMFQNPTSYIGKYWVVFSRTYHTLSVLLLENHTSLWF